MSLRPDSQSPFETANRTLMKSIGISLYRLILLVGVGASLYLNSHYATREDMEKVKSDMTDIKYTLRRLSEQDEQLKDHEARIRSLEHDSSHRP